MRAIYVSLDNGPVVIRPEKWAEGDMVIGINSGTEASAIQFQEPDPKRAATGSPEGFICDIDTIIVIQRVREYASGQLQWFLWGYFPF